MTAGLLEAIARRLDSGVLTAEIYPVADVGKLRVTYNWLYSALNADPGDSSTFAWNLVTLSPTTVALSPQQPYAGMTVYASVRPDNGYAVEVQAPGSADWITVASGDETIGLIPHGFLTVNLCGVNGQLLAVDGSSTSHDDHTGFLLHSNGSVAGPATNFFLAVLETTSSELAPLCYDRLNDATILAALDEAGASDPAALKRAIDAGVARSSSNPHHHTEGAVR